MPCNGLHWQRQWRQKQCKNFKGRGSIAFSSTGATKIKKKTFQGCQLHVAGNKRQQSIKWVVIFFSVWAIPIQRKGIPCIKPFVAQIAVSWSFSSDVTFENSSCQKRIYDKPENEKVWVLGWKKIFTWSEFKTSLRLFLSLLEAILAGVSITQPRYNPCNAHCKSISTWLWFLVVETNLIKRSFFQQKVYVKGCSIFNKKYIACNLWWQLLFFHCTCNFGWMNIS